MKGIVLASHCKLAEGFYDALKIFTDVEARPITCVGLQPEEAIREYADRLQAAVDHVDAGEGVVIFCDLAFGTPSNVAASLLKLEKYKGRLEVISGINLALILEFINMKDDEFDRTYLLNVGKEAVVSINALVE